MLHTTVGQALINDGLPQDLVSWNRTLDSKGIEGLLQQVAERYPERYAEIAKHLTLTGSAIATSTGGYTFNLDHLREPAHAVKVKQQIKADVARVMQNQKLTPAQRSEAIIGAVKQHQAGFVDGIYNEALRNKNPLALYGAATNGSSKQKNGLASLVGGDLLYEDHRGRTIPIPVLRSFSQGLSPAEFWAATYGGRRGIIGTKLGTQKAGFASKQLVQAAHRLVTVGQDDDEDRDPKGDRGYPTTTSDGDNVGALLSRPIGKYKRNTVITPRVLADLKSQGIEDILVRSPTVGGPEHGVYSRDVGLREKGQLPPRGDFVGIAGAHALSEPLAQGALGSKHGGGVAGQQLSGFAAVNAIVQVPKTFNGGATHAQVDGTVRKVEEAPQGGTYVHVGDEKHHVPAGFAVHVKPGDAVEAGDVMSEGMPNPAQIVEHKHLGEGRRYLSDLLRKTMNENKMFAHRRNTELLSRGLLDHVQLTEEYGDKVPDDVVSYNWLEHHWEPRVDTQMMEPSTAVGKYLEKPVLHYSVGTKIKPSVVQNLSKFKVPSIHVHDQPPPWKPVMTRAMDFLEQDDDWATRHLGSNLQRGMLDAAHRGASANPMGTSYVPALSLNPIGFGREGATKGWDPKELTKPPTL